jgi:hypothetical protein
MMCDGIRRTWTGTLGVPSFVAPGYTILHDGEADPELHSHGSVVSFSDSLRHKHDLSELLGELLDTVNLERLLAN